MAFSHSNLWKVRIFAIGFRYDVVFSLHFGQ